MIKTELAAKNKIILFDGVCNLCNNAVQFVIARDTKDIYRFASLQSDVGKQLTEERGIDISVTDSIILIEPGVAYYTKSAAALKIAQSFGGVWKLIGILQWIPEKISNVVYDYVAKNRYGWYGKKDNCMIPSPDLQNKFLD